MALGTKNVNYPTDYNLKTLNLVTTLKGNGVVNLMPFLIELNLFEDIYSSTISGEILVQDAMGLISSYMLNGTEFLQVQLQKTTQDSQFYSRNFRVYKVGKRVIGDNNDYEVFSLNFCSEEFLLSEQYRISKSFQGQQISDIITTILKDFVKVGTGNTKKINIEKTIGVYDFVLPNKKIFETINWLATYAQPATGKIGADMLFYETSKGYYFSSLQTLYAGPVYTSYKFDPKNITNDMNQKVTNASDFEVLEFFDTLSGTTNGTFANKVISLDILQRKVNKTDGVFNYLTFFNNSNKLNKNPITNNYKNRLGGTITGNAPTTPGLEMGTLRMATGNSQQKKNPYLSQNPDKVANDIMIEKYLPNRVAQLALSNYTKIKITVPGDPNLIVGRVVNFSTYQVSPTSWQQSKDNATRKPDPYYSGKYLVTAVRHIIQNKSYITIIEMCKDSVTGQYSGFDNNNALLKQFVNGNQA